MLFRREYKILVLAKRFQIIDYQLKENLQEGLQVAVRQNVVENPSDQTLGIFVKI